MGEYLFCNFIYNLNNDLFNFINCKCQNTRFLSKYSQVVLSSVCLVYEQISLGFVPEKTEQLVICDPAKQLIVNDLKHARGS